MVATVPPKELGHIESEMYFEDGDDYIIVYTEPDESGVKIDMVRNGCVSKTTVPALRDAIKFLQPLNLMCCESVILQKLADTHWSNIEAGTEAEWHKKYEDIRRSLRKLSGGPA